MRWIILTKKRYSQQEVLNIIKDIYIRDGSEKLYIQKGSGFINQKELQKRAKKYREDVMSKRITTDNFFR